MFLLTQHMCDGLPEEKLCIELVERMQKSWESWLVLGRIANHRGKRDPDHITFNRG